MLASLIASLATRFLLCGLAILVGLHPPPADAATPRAVELRVSPERDGIRVQYTMPRARSEFRFDPHAATSSAARIELTTPGLTLKEGVVSGKAPFKAFSLFVRPDIRRTEASYAVLSRIGAKGLLLYIPALQQDPAQGETRVTIVPPRGAIAVFGAAKDGLLFIGPSDYVESRDGLTMVVPPETPDILRTRIRDRANAFITFYTGALRRPPSHNPVLVVDHDASGGRQGFTGDVTPNGVVLLQLTVAMAGEDFGAESLVSRFLAHELFHLWNVGSYRDRSGLNGNWLLEGSAEYASWLAAEALAPEAHSLEDRVTQQLAPCMATLGDDALVHLADQRAQTSRYSCGAIVHWLADVAARRSGTDILSVWATLLADPGGYDIADFEKLMGVHNSRAEPLAKILRGTGKDRWPQIFAALKLVGVNVPVVPPGTDALRAAAVQTLLLQDCSGEGIGFETLGLTEPPVAVVLRTEPMSPEHILKCDLLSGDPHLMAVNAHSALGDWGPILKEVAAACADRAEIALALRRARKDETV
ncbi:MAG TPA: hypothetical protein VK403_02630, partial [Allosphingosinicella sp.]|nr:hypothetical protein [Allosphingosinicella sp.]